MSTATDETTLAPDELQQMDAYWRAASYLTVGQIYLLIHVRGDRGYKKEGTTTPPEVRAWIWPF